MKKDLLFKIIDGLSKQNSSLEDTEFEVDGVVYGVTNFDEDAWDDQGKYQYNTETGILCSYDGDYNVDECYGIHIEQCVSRSGSYFSDYNYEYEGVQAYIKEDVLVPEKIIPAHMESKYVLIKRNA